MQFCPSYCLVGASPLPLGVEYLFLVGSKILLSMNVQQLAAVLESLQKMSTRTSLPSYNCVMNFNFKNKIPFHWFLNLLLNYFLELDQAHSDLAQWVTSLGSRCLGCKGWTRAEVTARWACS